MMMLVVVIPEPDKRRGEEENGKGESLFYTP
jgi:hypothetical protein